MEGSFRDVIYDSIPEFFGGRSFDLNPRFPKYETGVLTTRSQGLGHMILLTVKYKSLHAYGSKFEIGTSQTRFKRCNNEME